MVEDLLKSGELPCLVATSSLELGIDMGAVDLVIQVESPKSVTAGLQRIGRAGHGVGEVSRGRIFPKFRADLLECAVVVKRMRDGDIEPTVVPRNPLDVLSQQVVAMVAAGDDWRVPELHDLVRHAYPFAELSRELLDSVLDMLDGRYPSEEFAELRPRIVWDRVEDTIRARTRRPPAGGDQRGHDPRPRALRRAPSRRPPRGRAGRGDGLRGASGADVPARGEHLADRGDHARPRDRHAGAGRPGAVPFWKGEGIGRPKELGEAIGAFAREAVDRDPLELAAEYDLDERAARNLSTFLREQRDATRVVPSDRTVVVERFRDEIGDWRLCVLSPFGGRVHAAWALALSARIRDDFGLESDAIWSDDGIIVHLPDADEPPSSELVMVEPDALEELVVRELSGSALFGARFRENAARALLLPRAYPGKRTPLWQQRLKAQSLLEVAKRYGQFPIVLETYRECLRDVLDLPGLQELLRGLHTRELSLVEAETQRASPFASSLLFDYVATYMYEGDTPNAERRAAALALDRDLLRELLGQEELRDLIDPAALDEVEADLQRLSDRTRAANSDGLHDVLRAVGDLTVDEAQARCLEAVSARRMLGELEKQRRAVRMRIGGEERWIASEDAGLYRDALGAVPPGGLPDAFLEEVEEPLARLARRYARTHGPFTTADARGTLRGGPGPGASRARGERPADPRRAAPRRQRARVVRRGRAAAPAPGVPRVAASRGGARRAARAGALPAGVAGRGLRARRRAPGWTGCASCSCRSRALALAPAGLGARRAPAPRGQLLARLARPALRRRRARLGRRGLARPELGPGRALLPRRRPLARAADLQGRAARPSRCTRPSALASPAAPPSGPICSPTCRRRSRSSSRRRSGTSSGPARSRTTRSRRCARRGSRWPPASATRGRRFARRRRPGAPQVQGRWSLTARLFADAPHYGPRMRALAEVLLERYGIVTRETVLAEGVPGGFAALYGELANLETLGTARRGLLRGGPRRRPVRASRRDRAAARPALRRAGRRAACWPPPIRPTPTAPRCPGRARDDDSARRPARVAGRLRGHARRGAGAVRRAWWQGPPAPARAGGVLAAPGPGGAGRSGPPRPRGPARRRALRRRARGGVTRRRAADRAGLPPGPAEADAERLKRHCVLTPEVAAGLITLSAVSRLSTASLRSGAARCSVCGGSSELLAREPSRTAQRRSRARGSRAGRRRPRKVPGQATVRDKPGSKRNDSGDRRSSNGRSRASTRRDRGRHRRASDRPTAPRAAEDDGKLYGVGRQGSVGRLDDPRSGQIKNADVNVALERRLLRGHAQGDRARLLNRVHADQNLGANADTCARRTATPPGGVGASDNPAVVGSRQDLRSFGGRRRTTWLRRSQGSSSSRRASCTSGNVELDRADRRGRRRTARLRHRRQDRFKGYELVQQGDRAKLYEVKLSRNADGARTPASPCAAATTGSPCWADPAAATEAGVMARRPGLRGHAAPAADPGLCSAYAWPGQNALLAVGSLPHGRAGHHGNRHSRHHTGRQGARPGQGQAPLGPPAALRHRRVPARLPDRPLRTRACVATATTAPSAATLASKGIDARYAPKAGTR